MTIGGLFFGLIAAVVIAIAAMVILVCVWMCLVVIRDIRVIWCKARNGRR